LGSGTKTRSGLYSLEGTLARRLAASWFASGRDSAGRGCWGRSDVEIFVFVVGVTLLREGAGSEVVDEWVD